MISIENVTYTYPGRKQPALKNISMRIRDGETVLLTGRSGSGKSSILRLINGLLLNDDGTDSGCAGKIIINGRDIRDMETWEIAEKIGTVFQNPKSQFFNIDTTDEILFGLESMGVPHDRMKEVLKRVTEDLGLASLLDRNIFELSGGEKQRIAFASIYAMGPDIYVLDEPSSNLDEEGMLQLRDNIIRVKKMGKTVVIAEHRLWYAADLADEVYYIDRGEITGKWSGQEFSALPEEDRIRMGLRSRNRVILQEPAGQGLDLTGDGNGCAESDTGQQSSTGMKNAVSRSARNTAGKNSSNNAFDHTDKSTGQDDLTPDGLSGRNLAASYRGRKVWKGLNFDFHKGEIIAVVGHNGAGKSTLAKIICGLKRASDGTLFWCGNRVTRKKLNRLCFMVMQDVNAQLFAESVREELLLDSEDPEQDGQKADTVLRECGLEEVSDRHPMTLSGGQKQRLAVADAIFVEKPVVIFDEPTSGLDYDHMKSFAGILKRMAEKGMVLVVITHDAEFIEASGAKLFRLS